MNVSGTNDLKDTIIRESTRLFLANGFRGTSVKQITEAVGIGKGTLYWYFKSKKEILETVFRNFEREFLEGFMSAVESCDGDFVTKYKVFHRYATEFARDNRDLALAFHTLMSEIVGTNSQSERVTKEIWERYRIFLEAMLEDGKREGTVPEEIDTKICAHVIMASHTGMLVEWFVNGESFDVPAFVRTFRSFLLRGIVGRER
jgi:AcrR family transcriptional regulator